MNERIEKLKNQAVDYAEEVFEYHGKDYREIVMEKFAELIVRECANVAKQIDPDDGDDYKSGRSWAGIEILKHFNVGVEE